MIKNKTIKFNVSHLILGAIILLLLLVVFLRPGTVDLSKYDKQKQEIDSLNRTLIDLQKKQVELDNSILQHQFKIDSLNIEINTTTQEITDIRVRYDKKLKDINNYTPSQLNDFFSERY
jgi:peptidoglycan hydrolase CwlO-like protein